MNPESFYTQPGGLVHLPTIATLLNIDRLRQQSVSELHDLRERLLAALAKTNASIRTAASVLEPSVDQTLALERLQTRRTSLSRVADDLDRVIIEHDSKRGSPSSAHHVVAACSA